METIKKFIAAIFLISISTPLISLLARKSGASNAVLGLYSPTYTIILLSYIIWVILYAGLILNRWLDLKGFFFFKRFLRSNVLILCLGLVGIVYFGLMLGFAAQWKLSLFVQLTLLISTVLVLPVTIIASESYADRNSLHAASYVFISSLVLNIIFVEVLLRIILPNGISGVRLIFEYSSPPPWLQYVGWAGRVNDLWYNASPGEFSRIPIQTNAQAIRESPTTYEKPEDVFRILVIGDSVTEAVEVPLNRTWHSIFEEQINQRLSDDIEVIAVGVGGWSTDQQLLYLRHEGCRYDPDVVMLQFTTNDPSGNHLFQDRKPYFNLVDDELVLQNFPYDIAPQTNQQEPIFTPFLQHSHLVRVYWQVIRFVSTRYTQFTDTTTLTIPSDFLPTDVPVDLEQERSYWALTEQLIIEFLEQVEMCGAHMVGFSEPALSRYYEASNRAEVREFHIMTFYSVLDQLGVPHPTFQETIAPFEEYINSGQSVWDLTYERASHFTPLGYEMLGLNIANWYIDNIPHLDSLSE